jgi:hypothetical protein
MVKDAPVNLVLLNGVLGALPGDALDDEKQIMARLGKSGWRMQARLNELGLPLTALCRTVKEASSSGELPDLDDPPWTALEARTFIIERLQSRAAAWRDASEVSRRKMLLKAITAGIARSAVNEDPQSTLASDDDAPLCVEEPEIQLEEPLTPEDLETINLAVLNGAIGALSQEELLSDEAICARLGKKQARVLQQGLRSVGLTPSQVCLFVKSASNLDATPHFDEEMWQEFPAICAVREMLQHSAVGWSLAKEGTRRKTLLKAITEAMKKTPGLAGADDTSPPPPRAATAVTIRLDPQSMALVEEVRSRVKGPVGIDELLRAGLIGLSEFDDEDIIELIGEVRGADEGTQ